MTDERERQAERNWQAILSTAPREVRERVAADAAEIAALHSRLEAAEKYVKGMVRVGYLITWFDPTYRGKQTISFDPCDKDDGTCVPVYTIASTPPGTGGDQPVCVGQREGK